jgi:hypothetical protein
MDRDGIVPPPKPAHTEAGLVETTERAAEKLFAAGVVPSAESRLRKEINGLSARLKVVP